MSKGKGATYKDAGVDIDAGDALVERIKPFAKATRRKGTMEDLGGFGALFDLKKTGYIDPLLVSSTDGVGTKLKIAQAMNKHDTIGIDLVAMCVNDLVVQGAEPLFFIDYFATGKLDVGVAEQVIKCIAKGCKEAGCALVGGETAEMPGMYKDGEYDLAGFSVGAVERKNLLPKKGIKKGDVVLGLASNGLHSNGFSLVRHIMGKEGLDYFSPFAPNPAKTFGDVFLKPTRIYVKSCLAVLRAFSKDIKALAHITGGGLTENIPRVLPDNLAVDGKGAEWKVPQEFKWLSDHGNLSPDERLRTFNMGIGMMLVVSPSKAEAITKFLTQKGETVYHLGVMVRRTGDMPQAIFA